MNTHITPNAQPLYTFQNRSGAFVDVLARAEYQGEQLDVTAVATPAGLRYVVEGTTFARATFTDLESALSAFDAERLTTLAAKFGTYEVATR